MCVCFICSDDIEGDNNLEAAMAKRYGFYYTFFSLPTFYRTTNTETSLDARVSLIRACLFSPPDH